ncbi:hypothetical protein A6V39_01610 [Candidatus Mycoplasma haematobovis]|uniref:Uncharacterized protein n=1 Tax=Candidatus Mycoplasma haematobovis TaxID=432608 RepID=A0A1A9QG70_9MOLU|nr:hypothetical protein [Candidatus Mycoplasma haematobovis]OAL10739.1 hypothetical protein A6V39_01610 [Candidatus Mycoplasma haematobovis]
METLPSAWRHPIKRFRVKTEAEIALIRLRKAITILFYSSVVDHMEEEHKNILTSSMGDTIVTPRQSFIAHFESGTPRHNYETFKIRFVEIFDTCGKHILANVKVSKEEGKKGADIFDFWHRFEILFYDVQPKRKKAGFFNYIKHGIFTVLKIFKLTWKSIAKSYVL